MIDKEFKLNKIATAIKKSPEEIIKQQQQKYQALENKYRQLEQELQKWQRTAASAHELYLKQKAIVDTFNSRKEHEV